MDPAVTWRDRFAAKTQELFGVDIRSLALLRIVLALLLMADLCIRACDLTAHYTDRGVMPRELVISEFTRAWRVCFHLMSGHPAVIGALFAVAFALAVGMLVGWRTRWMTALSWLFLISLHNRNVMILHGGDIFLRMILFWAMFLPLGACYSVDSARASPGAKPPQNVFSAGTLALLMQPVLVYVISALQKHGPTWHEEYSAVYYALSLETFTLPPGKYLLNYPELLKAMTCGVWWWEAVAPLLLFAPFFTGRIRLFIILGFLAMQAGFGATMRLGLFPWVSSAALIPFFTAGFWDFFARRIERSRQARYLVYYDGDCGFCQKSVALVRTFLILPHAQFLPAQSDAQLHTEMERHNSWIVVDEHGAHHHEARAMRALCKASPVAWPAGWLLSIPPLLWLATYAYRLVARNRGRGAVCVTTQPVDSASAYRPMSLPMNFVVAMLFGYVVAWNLASLPNPSIHIKDSYKSLAYLLRLDQDWSMFAPDPSKRDTWYVIPAYLSDDTTVNLFTGGYSLATAGDNLDTRKPERLSMLFKNYRWRKYFGNLDDKDFKPAVRYLARYLAREWRNTHERGNSYLLSFEIHCYREDTRPDFQPPETGETKLYGWAMTDED